MAGGWRHRLARVLREVVVVAVARRIEEERHRADDRHRRRDDRQRRGGVQKTELREVVDLRRQGRRRVGTAADDEEAVTQHGEERRLARIAGRVGQARVLPDALDEDGERVAVERAVLERHRGAVDQLVPVRVEPRYLERRDRVLVLVAQVDRVGRVGRRRERREIRRSSRAPARRICVGTGVCVNVSVSSPVSSWIVPLAAELQERSAGTRRKRRRRTARIYPRSAPNAKDTATSTPPSRATLPLHAVRLHVTVLELPARWNQPSVALAEVDRLLGSAPAPHLALLPETALTGYVSPELDFDLAPFAEPLDGPDGGCARDAGPQAWVPPRGAARGAGRRTRVQHARRLRARRLPRRALPQAPSLVPRDVGHAGRRGAAGVRRSRSAASPWRSASTSSSCADDAARELGEAERPPLPERLGREARLAGDAARRAGAPLRRGHRERELGDRDAARPGAGGLAHCRPRRGDPRAGSSDAGRLDAWVDIGGEIL